MEQSFAPGGEMYAQATELAASEIGDGAMTMSPPRLEVRPDAGAMSVDGWTPAPLSAGDLVASSGSERRFSALVRSDGRTVAVATSDARGRLVTVGNAAYATSGTTTDGTDMAYYVLSAGNLYAVRTDGSAVGVTWTAARAVEEHPAATPGPVGELTTTELRDLLRLDYLAVDGVGEPATDPATMLRILAVGAAAVLVAGAGLWWVRRRPAAADRVRAR